MEEKDKVGSWMQHNPGTFGKILSVVIFAFGVCLIVGAVKDWDWLYSADGHYQNNWSMGQISRYLGRGTARVIGFVGGLMMLAIGGFFLYAAFFTYKP